MHCAKELKIIKWCLMRMMRRMRREGGPGKRWHQGQQWPPCQEPEREEEEAADGWNGSPVGKKDKDGEEKTGEGTTSGDVDLGLELSKIEAEARDLFDQEVFDYWARREPIGCFEEWLKDQPGVLGGDPVKTLESLEDAVVTEVEAAAEKALQSQKKSLPDVDAMLGDVFAT